jgi:hypothetical protein
MRALLLFLALFLQGIPVQQGGTVTGVLRDSQSKPIAGVRIAAVARGDSIEAVVNGVAMAGLAETDDQGRFTLQNIPPGRYSIGAGRLDRQTYYPGTQSLADAKVLTITPGASMIDINFTLNDTSVGRATEFGGLSLQVTAATIPVRILTANHEKVPLSANGKPVYIRLESTAVTVPPIPIDGISFNVPGPLAADFRVVVEGLPETYSVKSITYGTRDITNGTFGLNPANFSTTSLLSTTTVVPQSIPNQVPNPTSFVTVATAVLVPGVSGSLMPAKTPASGLTITIGAATSRTSGGVRVSGTIGGNTRRSAVYLSGRPGTTFSDGSFEFRNVQTGRHVIATDNTVAPKATVVIVGDKDLDGIELKDTALLPTDIRVPKDPAPAGPYQPGTIVPLARITGTVLDSETNTPLSEGRLVVGSELRSTPIAIGPNGHFESMFLLPGRYDIKLEAFAHSTTRQAVTIEDKDVNVELVTRPLK